jgi:hypothetical protein
MMTDVNKIENLYIYEECWLCSFVLSIRNILYAICGQMVNDRWLVRTAKKPRPTDLTTGDPIDLNRSQIRNIKISNQDLEL